MTSSPGARFGSMVTAMVTPFDDGGALDADGAARLARHLVDNGNDGLVVAGTTGEGPVLSADELSSLWRAVREAVTVPILAGTGTNDTAHSIETTKLAEDAGVDGILLVTPYYNRPSQQGIAAHFTAVAASTTLPVLLYDIPVRSGRRIELDTMLHMARTVPNVVGVKDASGDVAGTARLVHEAPPSFAVYSGDDVLTLALLAVGAVGVISVAGHWAGLDIAEMLACFAKGDVEGARLANGRLLESYAFASSDAFPNPLPAKAACRVLGLPAGQCRLPMGPAPAELDQRAREVVGALGRGPDARSGGGPVG
ncbi:MAG TPA: 4-hydroxy-tetrahydrodipicolinate synthase [Acidimicrobiales bacterium]|nr:4-hydroxy-tetrahydrodipicolinate synthase [Acidimicrobiales bacterium]